MFFVYVISTSHWKNDLPKMLPPGSKSVRKKRKNQGEAFLCFLCTCFRPLARKKHPQNKADRPWFVGASENCKDQTGNGVRLGHGTLATLIYLPFRVASDNQLARA